MTVFRGDIFSVGRRARAGELVRLALVVCALAAVILPLLWTLRVSLKPLDAYTRSPSGLGGGLTLHNFTEAWTFGQLGEGFKNSFLIVPAAAVLATCVATLAGFALSKLQVPARKLVGATVVLGIGVPIPAIALPLFDQNLRLGLVDWRLGLVLVYGAIFAPWGTLFMSAYFGSLPGSLIESARLDGATTFGVFRRIAVPLAIPAIVSVFAVDFFIMWAELLLALMLLPGESKKTVEIALAAFSTQYQTGGPTAAAAALMAAGPVFLIFAMSQRFLTRGLLAGAVKH
jgi:ABC-type glycerol-3-phosphate transport system permease component